MTANESFVASLGDNEISNYWRLCDTFTIKQAALLIVGIDPQSESGAYCEGWKLHERPKGYEAAKQAITSALIGGVIKGKHFQIADTDMNGNFIGSIDGSTDIDLSAVDRDSVSAWMIGRGIRCSFFQPVITDAPGYLDPKNPRYAPKLAAAVSAWLAVTVANPKKSEKQSLEIWLRSNAGRFGLTDDEGNPISAAMTECATVANWKTVGGATPTPGA